MKSLFRRVVISLAFCAGILPLFAATGYRVTITPAGNKVILSWPAAGNYVLQSATNLASPQWATVTNPPTVTANNTNTVTYTNNSATRFFRLYSAPTGLYLTIHRSGTNFIVSWPASASNYVLQSSLALALPNWLTVTDPPTQTANNTNFVVFTNNSVTRFFRLSSNSNASSPYAGMVLIPAGAYTMGDVTDTNYYGNAAPVSVTVSAFYMDTNLVTYSLWQSVFNYALTAGYNFINSGGGQGPNNPVQAMDWYDAVKWCNARSQQAGLTPVYYLNSTFTQVYMNDSQSPETNTVYANWAANGYRLPTEAEWEKAARGGLSGQRFPWGNTISESQANYYGDPIAFGGYFYDLGPFGYNSQFYTSSQGPNSNPVGYFAPNGYGLHDMAGNVAEWCWDWYGTPYSGGTDPRGPATGASRVARGGDWSEDASVARCANREQFPPASNTPFNYVGFRCMRGH